MKPTSADQAFRALLEPGQVTELRAFVVNQRGYEVTYAGYFDDISALIATAKELDEMGAIGVYFIPNLVEPALLARANNRCKRIGKHDSLTKNEEITRRRYLLFDFDPKRPKGISATDAEKAEALERALAAKTHLEERGWPDPVEADSGNGAHLMYLVDLPADDGGLCERVTKALSAVFSDDVVMVDDCVHNAARIWKFYGTTARKGDPIDERPHRRAKVLYIPDQLEPVAVELLESLAAEYTPENETKRLEPLSNRSYPGETTEEDVQRILSHIPARPEYDDWIRIISGVLDGVKGDTVAAERILKQWSPEEYEGEYAEKMLHPLKRVRFGTVIYYAKQYGYSLAGYPKPPTQAANSKPVPADSETREKPALPLHAYNRLPGILTNACGYFQKWYERDVYLTALIAALSGALPKVRFQYGKTYYSPHLYAFVLALAASGKGVMQHAFAWLSAVDELLLKESAEARYEWELRKREYEAARSNRKKSLVTAEPPGLEPPEHCLIAGEDMSAASIAKRLHANVEGVFVGSTEADAVSRANGKDWGGFSDVLRRAFHHESVRVDRSTAETIRVPHPRLALVLSGTPDQFSRLIDSIEDGLFSRFAVYYFGGERRYESQRPTRKDLEFESHIKQMQQWVLSLYQDLRSRTVPLYIDIPENLWNVVDSAFADLFNHVSQSSPAVLDAMVKRGALIAFRIAAVLAVLRHRERGADLRQCQSVEAGPDDIEAATALALVYTEHGLRQAVEMLESYDRLREEVNPDVTPRTLHRLTGKQRALLDALPEAFTTAEAEQIGAYHDVPRSTLFTWLNRFTDTGILGKPQTGQYAKVKQSRPVNLDSLDSLDFLRKQPKNAVSELDSELDFLDSELDFIPPNAENGTMKTNGSTINSFHVGQRVMTVDGPGTIENIPVERQKIRVRVDAYTSTPVPVRGFDPDDLQPIEDFQPMYKI